MLVEQHAAALADILAMTPENDPQCAEVTMIAVSKMTMVLAGRESGEFASEAKGEAYMDALEDVPSWAVKEALRKWNRAECGAGHEYKWQPVPSTLRELAMIEVYRVMALRRQLGDLVSAVPATEFSDDHLARMQAKISQHVRGSLSVNKTAPRAVQSAPLAPEGKIFVIEGTPEWNAHQDYRRSRAMRPLMVRVLMIENVERRGAYVETSVPEGYDEATGERIPPSEEDAA